MIVNNMVDFYSTLWYPLESEKGGYIVQAS